MTLVRNLIFLSIIFFLGACQEGKVGNIVPDKIVDSNYKIIGYIAGWKGVDTDKIDAEKLTHINYAFANVIDGRVVEGEGMGGRDSLNLKKLRSLKERNPNLKILISVGGWTWSKGFSDAVKTSAGRKEFTDSAIDYLIRHQLDGLDFDWEYPALPGDNNPYGPEDKENFVLMLKSVREALDSLGSLHQKHYLHTIASGGFKEYLDANNLGQGQKYLDFINIMTYDFIVQSVSPVTGHHANLYAKNGRSAAQAVFDHIQAGVPAGKLVLGIPFYGRSWINVEDQNNGLFQSGNSGKGYSYKEILGLLDSGFLRKWDDDAKVPFLWHPEERTFVTFEDAESIGHKAKFIKENKLAGAMFWEYHEDSEDRRLLEALYQSLNKKD